MTYEPLASLYEGQAEVVRRNGVAYPAAIMPAARVTAAGPEAEIERRLEAAGAPHLAALRAARPEMHDGRITAMRRLQSGRLETASSSYFAAVATTDSLRAEYEAAPDGATLTDLPLRALAHRLAGGRPLASGRGRAAAIGVSVVVTAPGEGGRAFALGRRGREVAADPGKWHVIPSGMLEPDGVGRAVARELREELGVAAPDLDGRLRPLGIGFDLLRLRPDVCLRLDLDEADLGGRRPHQARSEFTELVWVELSPEGIGRLWRDRPPGELTAAAAAAVALLEGQVF